jgi:hypothetical protein
MVYTEIAMALRDRADIDAKNHVGFTALYWACMRHTDTAKLLMMNGADRINPLTFMLQLEEYTRSTGGSRGRVGQ